MQKNLVKKGLVTAIILLFIAVNFQPIIAEKTVLFEKELDYKNVDFEEAKEYLFQTIIDISNVPDVKELSEQHDYKIFTSNYDYKDVFSQLFLKKPKLLLNILFTKPSITYEYLNKSYKKGIDCLNIVGEKQALELIESINISNPDILNEVNNIIMNDKELSNRILTLKIMNNNLKSKLGLWGYPIICSIIHILILPIGLVYGFFEVLNNWLDNRPNYHLLKIICGTFYPLFAFLFLLLIYWHYILFC